MKGFFIYWFFVYDRNRCLTFYKSQRLSIKLDLLQLPKLLLKDYGELFITKNLEFRALVLS